MVVTPTLTKPAVDESRDNCFTGRGKACFVVTCTSCQCAGRGAAGGRVCHSCAPMPRRYATTSVLLKCLFVNTEKINHSYSLIALANAALCEAYSVSPRAERACCAALFTCATQPFFESLKRALSTTMTATVT